MKKNNLFCYPLPPMLKTLLIIGGLAVSASISAAPGELTEAQIQRIANIAKKTKTTITVVRITTTVKVRGRSKRINKKVRKQVLSFTNPKVKQWTKISALEDDPPSYTKKSTPAVAPKKWYPPLASNMPPVLEGTTAPSTTPVLVHTPTALDAPPDLPVLDAYPVAGF